MSENKVNKFYHIILLGICGTNVSNQVSDCLFYFDWGRLPRSRWRVYVTANTANSNYTSNQQCLINVDLGQNEVDLARGFNGAYAGTSQQDKNIFVGTFTNPSNQGTISIFQINSTANPPIYLDSTPNNNSFIQTLRSTGPGRALFTPNTIISKIVLSFEQLDDPIPRSIKTSYQVVFNSSLGTTQTGIGSYSYYFDWSTIPQGEYLVNTSFITNGNSVNSQFFNGSISVFIDLGQSNSTTFFPSNRSNQKPTRYNYVSSLIFAGTNTYGQGVCLPLFANSDTTKPLYLRSRPTNNDVNVILGDDYLAQFAYNPNNPSLAYYNYTLVLNFNLLG